MKKIVMTTVSLFLLTILVACNTSERVGVSDISAMESLEFSSVVEMQEFFSSENSEEGNVEMFNAVLTKQIFVPNEVIVEANLDAELDLINVNGEHIYYSFKISNPDFSAAEAKVTVVDEIAKQRAVPEESAVDSATLKACTEKLMIGVSNFADGEAALQDLAERVQIGFFEDHPGYYYTTAPYMHMENPLAYMLYWVEDGKFMQASVPADQLDDFWSVAGDILTQFSVE